MATYDLSCGSCGCEFEVFVQGFLKDENRVCPECDSHQVEQRFTGFLWSQSSAQAAAPACGPVVSAGCPSLGSCGCGCGH